MTDPTAKPAAGPGPTTAEELRALIYCGGFDPEAEKADRMHPDLFRACLALRAAGAAEDCLEGLEPRFTLTVAGLERLTALGLPAMPARIIAATARAGNDDVCRRSEDQAVQDKHAHAWLDVWRAYTGIGTLSRDFLPDRVIASLIWNRRLHRLLAQRSLWAQVKIVTGLMAAERDADLRTGNLHGDVALTPLEPAELIRLTYMGDESAAWILGELLGVDVPADLREQRARASDEALRLLSLVTAERDEAVAALAAALTPPKDSPLSAGLRYLRLRKVREGEMVVGPRPTDMGFAVGLVRACGADADVIGWFAMTTHYSPDTGTWQAQGPKRSVAEWAVEGWDVFNGGRA